MTVDSDKVIFDNKGNILTKKEEEIARKEFKEWEDTNSDNELSFEEYLKKEWFNNGDDNKSKQKIGDDDDDDDDSSSDSDIDISTIPVLESKRKIIEDNGDSSGDSDTDLLNIPVLESKILSTKCKCDSTNLKSQKKKVPQQVKLPEILESKRHFVENNNIKQKIISNSSSKQDVNDISNITSQLVPKNRLHLSHMEQISMDDNSLISNSNNHHDSNPKTIGIREESNIIYGVTRLSNYVDDKEDFYDRFNNSGDAKDLIGELQGIINFLDEHKSEEKPTEHLKSSNGLYCLLDHQKISDMNKSEMIRFIVAVNSLSRTLQEHKYGENILKIIGDSNNSIDIGALSLFRGLSRNMHLYFREFVGETDLLHLYNLVELDVQDLTIEIMQEIWQKENIFNLLQILATIHGTFLNKLKTIFKDEKGGDEYHLFVTIMRQYKDDLSPEKSKIELRNIEGSQKKLQLKEKIKKGLLSLSEKLAKEKDFINKAINNANKISRKIFKLFISKRERDIKGLLVFTKYSTVVLSEMRNYTRIDETIRKSSMENIIDKTLIF